MDTWIDPAKWIVVGLFACVHLTYFLYRRSSNPLDAKALIPFGLILGLSSCCCFSVIPVYDGVGSFATTGGWSILIPGICSALLACKSQINSVRVGLAVAGLLAMLVVSTSLNAFAFSSDYIRADSRLTSENEFEIENLLDEAGERLKDRREPIPSGYLDSAEFLQILGVHLDPPVFIRPTRLWHTWLTGLSRRLDDMYRIWVPAGNARLSLRHYQLERIRSTTPLTIRP